MKSFKTIFCILLSALILTLTLTMSANAENEAFVTEVAAYKVLAGDSDSPTYSLFVRFSSTNYSYYFNDTFFAELFDCTGEMPVSLRTYTSSSLDIDPKWFIMGHSYRITFDDSSVIKNKDNPSEETEIPGFSVEFTYEEAVENAKPKVKNAGDGYVVEPGATIITTVLLPINKTINLDASLCEIEKSLPVEIIGKTVDGKVKVDERGITVKIPKKIGYYKVSVYAIYEDGNVETIGYTYYSAAYSKQTRQAFAEFAQNMGEIGLGILSAPLMWIGWIFTAILFVVAFPVVAILPLFK